MFKAKQILFLIIINIISMNGISSAYTPIYIGDCLFRGYDSSISYDADSIQTSGNLIYVTFIIEPYVTGGRVTIYGDFFINKSTRYFQIKKARTVKDGVAQFDKNNDQNFFFAEKGSPVDLFLRRYK